ncbi:MAG: hypothetical protein SFZ02_06125 [bacterium]|nr:hypothetical protein [bacterium]
MNAMPHSKFYVAWVISRFIIITGVICIANSTILWIGGVRGITAYGQSSQYDTIANSILIQSILMGLFIIGCGYLLIYLRKKTFDTDKKNLDNIGIIKEVFTIRFSNIFGLIGGLITIGGIIWLIFISIRMVDVQNHSRFCDTYPNDSNCYYVDIEGGGGRIDDNWVYELFETPILPPIFFGFFFLTPLFIGQLIVIVPNIYIQVDMGLSDHA